MEVLKRRDIKIALMSKTERAQWSLEALNCFKIRNLEKPLIRVVDYIEFHKEDVGRVFEKLKKLSQVDYDDMLYFDDDMNTIIDVEKLGVIGGWVSEGISWEYFLGKLRFYNGETYTEEEIDNAMSFASNQEFPLKGQQQVGI